MTMLLAGDDSTLLQLRKQYASADIVSKERSPVGFFTRFSLQGKTGLRVDDKTFQIGDVDGSIDGVSGSVGFVFFVKNGLLLMLEGHTCAADRWPDDEGEIVLTYLSGEERDIERLREKWT
jgi:hypothetical protein